MKKPLYKVLYVQVLAAIVIGVLLGFFFPDIGASMKPLGDGFIKLIKMLIAPVIFCTVVIGIAGMEDMKKVGKVGGLALLYFEAVTTLALFVGLFLVNILQPGAGMHVDPATLDMNSVSMYATAENDREEQDLENVALRKGPDNGGGNDMKQKVQSRLRLFGCCIHRDGIHI